MASHSVTAERSLADATALRSRRRAALWDPTADQPSDPFEKLWARCPQILQQVLVSLAVFLMGLAVSGDAVVIYVHARRQLGLDEIVSREQMPFKLDLKSLYLEGFGRTWLISNAVSYSVYFGMGGFLHWYFYIQRRNSAQKWKLQPDKWISRDLELHAIKVGILSLFVSGTFSALLGSYVANGGWSMVYYNWSDYGLLWGVLQWPVIFVYQDYATYLLHRAYHTPWLYKHFHKLHHRYKQPTAFSAAAMHPVEMLHIQITACLPLFIFPCHWLSFYLIALHTYYCGILLHSGVNFKAAWWQPWQPDTIFHDRHHEHTHVNFGFNIWLWDKIHGTGSQTDAKSKSDRFYRSNF